MSVDWRKSYAFPMKRQLMSGGYAADDVRKPAAEPQEIFEWQKEKHSFSAHRAAKPQNICS